MLSSSDNNAALQAALALHQRGQLDAAAAAYRAVLATEARNADALHLLGVVARQQGRIEESINLIGRAIAIHSHQATMHCNLGAALQDADRPDAALASYETALALHPAYALAWSNRGNTLRKLGRLDDALDSYAQALALRPDYPEALCQLAIALHDAGRDSEACGAAARALALRPGDAEALCAQGNALLGLGQFEAAAASFADALARRPRHGQAACWRGIALHKAGAFAAAVDSYRQAIAVRPDFADAHQYLGNALRALGDSAAALDAYRQAQALGSADPALGFAIAALTDAAPADGAPPAYVKSLFDEYAGHFDAHLDQLHYQTPALLDACLARLLAPGALDVLDLGCGTGLCGPMLRPRARRLAGVDLSEKMLAQARARGLYDTLDCAELSAWLGAQTMRYGLVVAADVFVYAGALDAVFARVAAVLEEGGWFAFSVEAGEGDGFTLQPSSRYAHSLDYVRRCAVQAGLSSVEATPAELRRERGAPVAGHIVVLRNVSARQDRP